MNEIPGVGAAGVTLGLELGPLKQKQMQHL